MKITEKQLEHMTLDELEAFSPWLVKYIKATSPDPLSTTEMMKRYLADQCSLELERVAAHVVKRIKAQQEREEAQRRTHRDNVRDELLNIKASLLCLTCKSLEGLTEPQIALINAFVYFYKVTEDRWEELLKERPDDDTE